VRNRAALVADSLERFHIVGKKICSRASFLLDTQQLFAIARAVDQRRP